LHFEQTLIVAGHELNYEQQVAQTNAKTLELGRAKDCSILASQSPVVQSVRSFKLTRRKAQRSHADSGHWPGLLASLPYCTPFSSSTFSFSSSSPSSSSSPAFLVSPSLGVRVSQSQEILTTSVSQSC